MSTVTLTDNELIAEFMGGQRSQRGQDTVFYFTPDFKGSGFWHIDYIPFDRSWDWLMPVVEKIERIDGVRVVIKKSRCRILLNKKVFSCHTIFKINSMYRVVVEFIKWYNQQPK